MYQPKLKLRCNKKMDMETALVFRNIKAGGLNFRTTGIIGPHPQLKNKNLSKKTLKAFVDDYYHKNAKELSVTKVLIEKTWAKIAPKFFSLTNKLFKNHPFPRGKYICYLSIWNINPRDLRDKTFQIYYKTKIPRDIIVHELLHFIFFDYLHKNFHQYQGEKQYKKIWPLSEVFNVLIQNQSSWRSQLKLNFSRPYPSHKNILKQLQDIWKKTNDIDFLIQKYFVEKKIERTY